MGREKGESAGQDQPEEEKLRDRVLPVSHNSTPSLLHLSFGCSRSLMLSPHASLPPLIHLLPAPADSLFGPRSPVIHSTCQSRQWHRHHNDSCFQAVPVVSTSVPSLKACGFKSADPTDPTVRRSGVQCAQSTVFIPRYEVTHCMYCS